MVSSENSAALIYAVPEGWAKRAHVDAAKYKDMYDFSVSEPDTFGIIMARGLIGSSHSRK